MLFPGWRTRGRLSTGRALCRRHMRCLGTSPLTDPGDLGARICTFTTHFSPAAKGRGDRRHGGALCVRRAAGDSPRRGDAGTSHCHVHGGGRVHPLLVPPLAAGSPPSVYDGLRTESMLMESKEFVPVLAVPHRGGCLRGRASITYLLFFSVLLPSPDKCDAPFREHEASP